MIALLFTSHGQRARHALLIATLMLCAPAASAADGSAEQEAHTAYEQAMQAWREQEWVRAELQLERALMFMPEHAEARLQLALLLAKRGRVQAAQALIESLIADPRTPPAHRQQLQALLAAEAPSRPNGTTPQAQAKQPAKTWSEASMSYTRNPYLRASLGQLDLTLPDGILTLPLESRVQPAWVAGLSVGHAVTQGEQPWGIELQTQHILGDEAKTASRAYLYWGGVSLVLGSKYRWGLLTQRTYDGVERQTITLAGQRTAWQWSVGLFTESEPGRQGQTLRLDGVVVEGKALQAYAYGETETANAGRPGYAAAGLWTQWALAPRWALQLHARAQQDWTGYSALLDSGARRRLLSVQGTLERNWPLGADHLLVARAYYGERTSNLDLFNYRDSGLQLSLQRVWR